MHRLNVYITDLQLKFFRSKKESIAEHVRRAIDFYIENLKEFHASASQSEVKNNG